MLLKLQQASGEAILVLATLCSCFTYPWPLTAGLTWHFQCQEVPHGAIHDVNDAISATTQVRIRRENSYAVVSCAMVNLDDFLIGASVPCNVCSAVVEEVLWKNRARSHAVDAQFVFVEC